MGVICSCFGRASRQERFPKEHLNDKNSGLLTTANNNKIMKQRCPQQKDEAKKRDLNPQEKQKQQQQQFVNDKEYATLRDCLLSSPALNTYYSSSTNADEQPVHCHLILKQNKVYPSLAEDNSAYASNSRSSFSKQRLLKSGELNSTRSEVDVSSSSSSLKRSQSNKIKKRVSFKLPEEADIFIYDIQEEIYE